MHDYLIDGIVWEPLAESFSDFSWEVKIGRGGPRLNTWFPNNIIRNPLNKNELMMGLSQDATGLVSQGVQGWTCSEIRTRARLGFGTYQVFLRGDLGQLADNWGVLGCFNYSADTMASSGIGNLADLDGTNEIDIEVAKFQEELNPSGGSPQNLNFGVYPPTTPSPLPVFDQHAVPYGAGIQFYTLRFNWTSTFIEFHLLPGWQRVGETTTPLATFLYAPVNPELSIPQVPLNFHFNVWLLHNQTPRHGVASSVFLHDFQYTGSTVIESNVTMIRPQNGEDTIPYGALTVSFGVSGLIQPQEVWLHVAFDGEPGFWYPALVQATETILGAGFPFEYEGTVLLVGTPVQGFILKGTAVWDLPDSHFPQSYDTVTVATGPHDEEETVAVPSRPTRSSGRIVGATSPTITLLRQGESFPFVVDLSGKEITGWTCFMGVKRFPGSPAQTSRIMIPDDQQWHDVLRSTETALLAVGLYYMIVLFVNTETDESEQLQQRIQISKAWG